MKKNYGKELFKISSNFQCFWTLPLVPQTGLKYNNFKGDGCKESQEIINGLFEWEKVNGTYPSDTNCQVTCNNGLNITGKPGSLFICEDDTWEPLG